jgi:hypothetical protein
MNMPNSTATVLLTRAYYITVLESVTKKQGAIQKKEIQRIR